MVEVFEWCLELGVQHISVYAFSIDNFKRSCGEVGDLMHLAERKYSELLQVRRPLAPRAVCMAAPHAARAGRSRGDQRRCCASTLA
jgi:ditrans,polycis-polyprenyl diphosphate synthase